MAESTEPSNKVQKGVSSTKQTSERVPVDDEIEAQVADSKLNEIEVEHHPDCPVCLQSCNYPVQLPCGHIFCYLCIKGVALRSRRCALCRQDITVDSIENPTLVKPVSFEKGKTAKDEGSNKVQDFVWYYEGRNGWWQYDEKTATEVEKAFKSGKRSCQLLIAGFLYLIDFENMSQMRRNEPGRRRRIKRDKPGAERKGVAGIRLPVKAKPKSTTTSTDTETSERPNSSSCSNNSNREIGKSSEESGRKTEQREETQQEVRSNQQEVVLPNRQEVEGSNQQKVVLPNRQEVEGSKTNQQEVEPQNQQEIEPSNRQEITERNTRSEPERSHCDEPEADNSEQASSFSP